MERKENIHHKSGEPGAVFTVFTGSGSHKFSLAAPSSSKKAQLSAPALQHCVKKIIIKKS